MKKVWVVFATVALVLTLGTAAYAASNEDGGFKQMLPTMKQVHPNVSEQQLQEMYSKCQVNGQNTTGMMKNGSTSMQNMMSTATSNTK